MATRTKPSILIVDDQNGQAGLKSYLESNALAHLKVRHPNDLQDSDLQGAHLILVDFQLDDWPERDNVETSSLKPVDGLALAAVLRRQATKCPTAIALHTGKMAQLASPLPPDHREHTLARLHNLEWVFQKSNPGKESSLAVQLVSLASAVCRLPPNWSTPSAGKSLGQLEPLFAVKQSELENDQLFDDVANCLPPIHELSQWSHGLAVIRWFLHRILPYPCFLWDTHYLASRFRLDVTDLRAELEVGRPLRKALLSCEYKGILSDFLGTRWWRSKIEGLLWSKTQGASSDTVAVQRFLKKASGNRLKKFLSPESSIVCIDENYQPLDKFVSIGEAIRIRPDDWPTYADQPWTTRRLALEKPNLHALVIREDRGKLVAASS